MPQSETPARLTLTDLQSNETVEVQFNPSELKRKVSANYARKEVLGNSHQEHEYLYTGNQTISFSLFNNVESPAELTKSNDALKFLESLQYAPEDPESIASAAPPRVLIVWPRTLSITCRLMTVSIAHQRFNRFGDTIQWTANCEFEEARVRRLNKRDVRLFGSIRTPSFVNEEGDLVLVDE